MTPERLAEIRAYIRRLDLDQLPPWTVEQAIIRDLWEALQEAERRVEKADVEAMPIRQRDAYVAAVLQFMRDRGYVFTMPADNPYRADVS